MTVQDISAQRSSTKDEFQAEQVLTIASGHFVHDVYSAFLPPLLPLIIEKMSLSLTLARAVRYFVGFLIVYNYR